MQHTILGLEFVFLVFIRRIFTNIAKFKAVWTRAVSYIYAVSRLRNLLFEAFNIFRSIQFRASLCYASEANGLGVLASPLLFIWAPTQNAGRLAYTNTCQRGLAELLEHRVIASRNLHTTCWTWLVNHVHLYIVNGSSTHTFLPPHPRRPNLLKHRSVFKLAGPSFAPGTVN